MKGNNVDESIFCEEVIQYSKVIIDLLKKVENKEISVNDLIRKFERNKYKVCVYKNRIAEEIDIDDIYYITVLDGITRIFTENDSYNSYISLNEWGKRLDSIKEDKFYRSHRNYIVNTDRITEIGDYILFDNDERALVPVRKRSGLRQYCIRNNVKGVTEHV